MEDCSRSAETDRLAAASAARLRGCRAVLTAAAAAEAVEVVDAEAMPLFWRVDLPEAGRCSGLEDLGNDTNMGFSINEGAMKWMVHKGASHEHG